MALDARYVTTVSLEEYFVDKDNGTPNSFGTIEFWQDDNRIVPKNVFELTGAPPNYTYTALPNPITLSAVGTPSDNNGNNVAIYYFPYDADGNVQLYYVVVRDQFGTIQETREAWPNTTPSSSPNQQESGLLNQIVNPQFAFVDFLPTNPLTITNNAGAGLYSYSNLITGWTLNVTYTGNGSTTIARTPIAGTSQYPGNPPYTISITPGANVSLITLSQDFIHNPNIFAPANGGTDGYLAASILLAPLSSIMMFYQPNGQAQQPILSANNTTGSFAEFDNTVQLTAANNANTGDNGLVSIILQLPIVGTTTFSNVQIVGLSSNVQGIKFNQETVVQQFAQTFSYQYGPIIDRPQPDYLVGWNFPYNPTQFLGPTLAASAAGANTSRYVWDQTIIFQSANNGPAISRSATGNGWLRITATNTTQFAVIQYLPQIVAREMLQKDLSDLLSGLTNQVGGITGKVTMWATTGAALPSCAANLSIVATLDATGRPATFNLASGQPWVEISRTDLGDGVFTFNQNVETVNSISGYNHDGNTLINTATWFAIVVGFSSLTAANYVEINYGTVVPGLIPSRPAPKTPDEVLRECQYYYEMSFPLGTIPADGVGDNTGDIQTNAYQTGNPFGIYFQSIEYKVTKFSTPAIALFNPHPAATAGRYWNYDSGNSSNAPAVVDISTNQFKTQGSGNVVAGDRIGVHWTSDSRLGV